VTEPLIVDVWSDVACPWCYIGKRRFEAGLAAFGAGGDVPDVRVRYHSFELTPDTPVDFAGSEVDFLMEYKQMPEATVRRMVEQVTEVAASVGLAYRFDTLQHTNTVKAHRLLQHAHAEGRQLELVERLMAAYWLESRHLGRDEELADLAAEVGLDREEARVVLAGDAYLDAVREDERAAEDLGIHGVPFYVVDRRFGVSGAQPPEHFTEVLRHAAGDRAG